MSRVVHKTPSHAPSDSEDRLQRALAEVQALKLERNELQAKLRRVQTQFQRLTADFHARPPPSGGILAEHSTLGGRRPQTTRPGRQSDLLPALRPGSLMQPAAGGGGDGLMASALQGQLALARAEIQSLRSALRDAQHEGHAFASTSTSGGGGGGGPQQTLNEAEIQRLRAEVEALKEERDQLTSAATELREDLYATQAKLQEEQLAHHADLQKAATSTAAATTAAATTAAANVSMPSLLSASPIPTGRSALSSPAPLQLQEQQQQQASVTGQLNREAVKQLEEQYKKIVDALVADKRTLAERLEQMRDTLEQHLPTAASVDPTQMAEMQSEVQDKAQQVTLLGSRLHAAQTQVETLKRECARLVEELKKSHGSLAEAKQAVFQLEREKGALEVRAGRVDELEAALRHKSEELLHSEKEVLTLVSSLQACHRDTESAVRQELNARIVELQEARDQADSQRRSKEKALIEATSQLSEARRMLESAREDLQLYRGKLAQTEKERTELSAQLELAGHTASDLTDAELHKAFAVAAMKKRSTAHHHSLSSAGGEGKTDGGLSDEAAGVLDLYEGLRWDDAWEQGKVREAFAAAVLDLELAETRCAQLAEQAGAQRLALDKLTRERDELFEENAELRRRVSHVQTVFAKQQLEAYRSAAAADAAQSQAQAASLRFALRGLRFAPEALAVLGLASPEDPVSLFLSLDGLQDYEVMVSPTLHSLADTLDAQFSFEGLGRDEVTLAEVQRSVFTVQLHQQQRSGGSGGSRVVAMAELAGATVLAARETPIEERLTLFSGDGVCVASLAVEVCSRGLLLPVLLGQPLQDGVASLSAAEVRAALVALRAVRYLRVQVFEAHGLPVRGGGGGSGRRPPSPSPSSSSSSSSLSSSSRLRRKASVGTVGEDTSTDKDAGAIAKRSKKRHTSHRSSNSNTTGREGGVQQGALPMPYVFYTAHSPTGVVHSIADTVVRPASGQPTADPSFAAAPVDHRVVPDRELVRLLAHGSIVFVVFDARAADVRSNLGLMELPLRPLLASPHAFIRTTERLHPQGSLEVGLSWVTAP